MNWINIPNPSPGYGGLMWSICPIDSDFVYAVAGYDFIMKSSNGGLNWNVLSGRPGSISAFKGLYFLNRDTGWFVGTNKVFRTYDGGQTLDSFYVPWFDNFEIYFKDINTGIITGDGRVFKSIDGGENWFDTNVPIIAFHMFKKLAVVDDHVWVTSGRPCFRSTNFCSSWETVNSSQAIGSAIFFINKDTGFSGGGGSIMYRTTNGGYNWVGERTDSSSLAFISTVEFVNDSIEWYCGGVGKIYKTVTGGTITSFQNVDTEIITDFTLYQNYPNPFNPKTTIKFDIKSGSTVKLEIFDMLGRNVSTPIDKKLEIGTYEINYDMSDINSGVYFYKLSTDSPRARLAEQEAGSFSKTMKMLLIK